MKTFLTISFTLILMASYAQKNMYEQSMLSALEKLNQAETTRDYTDAANIFERIAQTETSEWLPLYHASHAYLIMGFTEQDLPGKDAYFDKAQEFLERAFRIAPEESELFSLQAFIYPGKITIDPVGRASELLGKMHEAIDKAIRLNPDNPRSYYLKAITLLHMPEAFGGGKSVAKPIFEAAQQKFDQYKPKSPIWPNWGKEMNEEELSKL